MVGVEGTMRHMGKVVENRELCNDIYEILIECPEIAGEAKPGQFLHVRIKSGIDPLLRRPISISRVYRDMGHISLIYQVIGRGTKEMTSIKKGGEIDIMGPLGNGFTLFPGKKCAVVGGGMGVAPLLELAASIPGCDAYIGFRCSTFKLDEYRSACKELFVATEDGSTGSRGYVTDLIKDIKEYDIVYTCGPKLMMKKVKELCENNSVRCFVSIEERMGCGIGACLVCACRIKDGAEWHHKKVCTDGPVFEAGEVDFDA
ncbi:MAG TPA: dihydroorotate dehydrogenase electron transfer subunit [Clostridia bacterium]|nr:dihydroorotate dehydrogenase electron transfer subunit [Clostridia bacterium]